MSWLVTQIDGQETCLAASACLEAIIGTLGDTISTMVSYHQYNGKHLRKTTVKRKS